MAAATTTPPHDLAQQFAGLNMSSPSRPAAAAAAAGTSRALRRATYIKVNDLHPSSIGVNLVVKVVKVDVIVDRTRVDGTPTKRDDWKCIFLLSTGEKVVYQTSMRHHSGESATHGGRIAEVTVGDETGTVIFRARDEQVDFFTRNLDRAVVLRNAGITMYKGFMRLIVNKWGKLTPYPDGLASTPSPPQSVDQDNDKSAVEYELVPLEEQEGGEESGYEQDVEEGG